MPDEWNGICQRCGKKTNCHIMSMFNTDLICWECKCKERKHPRYRKAVEAENAAIRSGELNFLGIGFKKDEE